MKFVCNQNFSVVEVIELFVVCQKLIHVYAYYLFLLYKVAYFVYVLVYRNILMYDILGCQFFM